MILYVRGRSGRLYEVMPGWINLVDGLGQRVAGTCWRATFGFPQVDDLWAMATALQVDEERVLRRFPWRDPRHGAGLGAAVLPVV